MLHKRGESSPRRVPTSSRCRRRTRLAGVPESLGAVVLWTARSPPRGIPKWRGGQRAKNLVAGAAARSHQVPRRPGARRGPSGRRAGAAGPSGCPGASGCINAERLTAASAIGRGRAAGCRLRRRGEDPRAGCCGRVAMRQRVDPDKSAGGLTRVHGAPYATTYFVKTLPAMVP